MNINYLEKIKTLYQLEEFDFQGFSAEEIIQAEQRLNISFPETLKEYYLLLGKNKSLNQVYNRLFSPSEMDFADDFLVFYEEYQQVCYWAIKKEDLQKENPPVYEGYLNENEAFEWYLSHASISLFWLEMAFYNGTLGGGLKYHANIMSAKKIQPQSMEKLVKNYREITALEKEGQRFYTIDYQNIISVCYDACGACAVFAGTQDETNFEEILTLFGEENWSYISDEDEED